MPVDQNAVNSASSAETRQIVEKFKLKMDFLSELLVNLTGAVTMLVEESKDMCPETKQKLHDALKPAELLLGEAESSTGEDALKTFQEFSDLDHVFDDELFATIHQINALNNTRNPDNASTVSSASNAQDNTCTSDSDTCNVSL